MAQLKDLLVAGPGRVLNDLYVQSSIYVTNGIKIGSAYELKSFGTGLSLSSAGVLSCTVAGTITGSGTNGYLTKWSGGSSITNGPQLGSDATKFLNNTGNWTVPTNTTYSAGTGLALSGTVFSLNSASSTTLGGIKLGHTEGANEAAVVLDEYETAYVENVVTTDLLDVTTGTASTAKPIHLKADDLTLLSEGWKKLGGRNSAASLIITTPTEGTFPAWLPTAYAGTIAFGTRDVHGYVSTSYSAGSPTFAIGGGSVSLSTDDAPAWYMKFQGTSGTTYNMNNFLTSSSSIAYSQLPVGTGSSQVAQGSHNHDSTYLKLSGGTMTGTLTAKANVYDDTYTGALNMANSNIYGLNAIYFADASETASEGIHFYRSGSVVDSLYAKSGKLYFTPNRTLGQAGTDYEVITTLNYISNF